MILHFITDDKFADYAIRQFSEDSMRSKFVLVSDDGQLRYAKEVVGIPVVRSDSQEFQNILGSLSEYQAVVLHGMFWPWEETLIKSLPDTIKLAWVFWGGDIYGRSDLKTNYLAPRTRKLFLRKHIRRFIKSGFKKENKYEIPIDCFRRVDYCLSDVHEDYLFACKYIGKPMKELWYNYYSIEDTIGPLVNEKCDGQNLLIGNSCTIECNHLDVFPKLRGMDIKVIAPLSYGEPWLKKVLIDDGNKHLRDFSPLVDFIPLDEYNNILKSCSFVLMAHYRQQAFGNILTALWLGARVFLSKKNLLYGFFKRIGCILFSVEDDFSSATPRLSPLTDGEVMHNRNVLQSIYGRDVMHSRIVDLVSELDN